MGPFSTVLRTQFPTVPNIIFLHFQHLYTSIEQFPEQLFPTCWSLLAPSILLSVLNFIREKQFILHTDLKVQVIVVLKLTKEERRKQFSSIVPVLQQRSSVMLLVRSYYFFIFSFFFFPKSIAGKMTPVNVTGYLYRF